MKFPSPGAERVARALHDGGPSTAAALAQALGLSGAVVRRHLDALVDQGLVAASAKPPFGPTPQRGRGRPARVFALTDRGSHAFDLAYDDLALSALRFLAGSDAGVTPTTSATPGPTGRPGTRADDAADARSTDAVAAFARHRAEHWAHRHAEEISALPGVDERVDALVAILTEEGYAATSVEGDGGVVQVCQHHCPISHVAEQFPQLCEAETLAFEQLLGTHVTRLATIAHGDGVCTTLVPILRRDARQHSRVGSAAPSGRQRPPAIGGDG